MFRIKICGVTDPTAVRQVASAGADAIGLNFYVPSPRYVSPDRAAQLVEGLSADVARVGVFVNATVDMIREIGSRVGLDYVQLHGDEPIEMLDALRDFKVIRAFRCRDSGLETVSRFLRGAANDGRALEGVLVDAYQPGQFGGTGQVLDWQRLANWRDLLPDTRLILAGGLQPSNVSAAIELVRPAAVDTASGVESAAGIKDPAKLKEFVAAAQRAFAAIDD